MKRQESVDWGLQTKNFIDIINEKSCQQKSTDVIQ